jgi:hypothetical protein
MARYRVQAGTILDHLARYVMAGNVLENTHDLLALSSLSPDQQQTVFEAFDELGTEYLRPTYDKLNGAASYEELKILRLCYLGQKR